MFSLNLARFAVAGLIGVAIGAGATARISTFGVPAGAATFANMEFADSDRLAAGQWAIAIGEPLELKPSVTLGRIGFAVPANTVRTVTATLLRGR